jgi:hypothetical protein
MVYQLLNGLRYLLLVTEGDEIQKLWLDNARYPAVKIGLFIDNAPRPTHASNVAW